MAERFKLIPAVYILLWRHDQILMLLRARTGYQDGRYGLVSGHLDGDELATTTAIREAKEEAGVVIKPQDLRLIHVCYRLTRNQAGQERLDLCFEARIWEGEPRNLEPDRCDEVSWHSIRHLPANTIPLVRAMLESIGHGIVYSEYTEEPA